jgi:hypothetical protein
MLDAVETQPKLIMKQLSESLEIICFRNSEGIPIMDDGARCTLPYRHGPQSTLTINTNTPNCTLKGVWHSYAPPVLTNASETSGTVVEVQSGDTVIVLPDGKLSDLSLASIRAPRTGSDKAGRADNRGVASSSSNDCLRYFPDRIQRNCFPYDTSPD